MSNIPQGYQPLEGSEERPPLHARTLGAADPNEVFKFTIVLRRRLDGAPLPDHDYFLNTPPSQRRRMSNSHFAALYGACDADINKVTRFIASHRLTVVETHAARRIIIVSGTVRRVSAAFAVNLGRFEHQIVITDGDEPETETFRGLDGFIHLPSELEGIIVGVFGLDNRTVIQRNRPESDDSNNSDDSDDDIHRLTVAQVASLYNFPDIKASGQTIAIVSHQGYKMDDIKAYFKHVKLDTPAIKDVSIDGATNNTTKKLVETTMDICISASAGAGASVAVYFSKGTKDGWVNLLGKVAHPGDDDPVCSVLSSSYYRYNGDDKGSSSFMKAVSNAFLDLALQGITACVASGDRGSYSKIDDKKAHVQYPASDPWVMTVGGTTIANVKGSSYTEYVWNKGRGATGGGISAFFGLPSYQSSASVPLSKNDDKSQGRGVPDVAANSDPHSGYKIPVNGKWGTYGGTSIAAPLWAGFIARINAAIGENIGFVNPAIYALGSSIFNDIDGSQGPKNNQIDRGDNTAPGYPANAGWDACTGWGSINGTAFLDGIAQIFSKSCIITPLFQSASATSSSTLSFSVLVDGFRPADFGIQIGPPVKSTVNPAIAIIEVLGSHDITCELRKIKVQDDALPPTPQCFAWVYSLTITGLPQALPKPGVVRIQATITSLKGESVTGIGFVRFVVSPPGIIIGAQ